MASDDGTSLPFTNGPSRGPLVSSGFVAQKQESPPPSRHSPASRTYSLASILNEPTLDQEAQDPTNAINMPAVLTPKPLSTPDLSVDGPMMPMPPKAKPGRKLPTDTPPNKRLAQNRAAQRAFRERRVAHVRELEERLDRQNETHDEEKSALGEKVRQLELELQSYRSRYLLLEKMLEHEHNERVRAETEAELSKRQRNRRCPCHGSVASLPSTLPPTDHHGTGSIHIQQSISPPAQEFGELSPKADSAVAQRLSKGSAAPEKITLQGSVAPRRARRHRNFDRAAGNIRSWLKKLRTSALDVNNKGSSTNQDRYSSNAVGPLLPIEVEAGIMSVPTNFDEICGAGPVVVNGASISKCTGPGAPERGYRRKRALS